MKNLILLLALITTIFSCKNDIEIPSTNTGVNNQSIISEYNPENKLVQSTVYGKVYDENETPVQNAIVSYNGKTYTTNELGLFTIENESMDSEGTFFTVDAEGFFRGSRRVYPREGSINYVNIQLLTLNTIGTFNASAGGEVSDDFGLNISFPPNSIQSSTGSIYNGEVTVTAKWLNPIVPNIAEIMPGDLIGLDAETQEASLETYGIMAVELFDENGNKINIAEGNTATLSFPLPEELINQAPQEIPLWSFYDEQFGIWVEEGSASLQGEKYVGEVSHFSFWSCNEPFELVTIKGKLQTYDGEPMPFVKVVISTEDDNKGRSGYTDILGLFTAKVPKGEILKMSVENFGESDCQFREINLGAFDIDTDINPISLEETETFTITGKIEDCDGLPIENGLIRIFYGGSRTEYYLGSSNNFELDILNCYSDNEISIVALDPDNIVEGPKSTMPINSEVSFGTIKACDSEVTEYFTLSVNGQSATIVDNIEARLMGNYVPFFEIGSYQDSLNNEAIINANINFSTIGKTGTFTEEDFSRMTFSLFSPSFSEDANLQYSKLYLPQYLSSFTMIIDEYGGLGGYISGVFNGTGVFIDRYDSSIYYEYPFDGSFRLPIK